MSKAFDLMVAQMQQQQKVAGAEADKTALRQPTHQATALVQARAALQQPRLPLLRKPAATAKA